jgi:hypothetical protein
MKMYRFLLAGAFFVAGCQGIVGPFAPRKPERVDDPLLTIGEQQRKGRDRLALPEASATVAPRTYTELPGPHSR